MAGQPGQGQFEDRAPVAEAGQGVGKFRYLAAIGLQAQAGDIGGLDAMDGSQHPAALPGQCRPDGGKGRIADDLLAKGLARDKSHDEAFAKSVLRRQDMKHGGGGDAGHPCPLHQQGFGRKAGGQIAFPAHIRRPPQDAAAAIRQFGKPGFLTGPARKAPAGGKLVTRPDPAQQRRQG